MHSNSKMPEYLRCMKNTPSPMRFLQRSITIPLTSSCLMVLSSKPRVSLKLLTARSICLSDNNIQI
nr:MAG TPA: hypothetical protein [Caudoviricetes sp.]